MMSRQPPQAAPKTLALRQTDTITEIREYELITPLFGGGVDPATPDPITVVRASEIRGQLRFWWRATRGGRFGADLKAMRDAEEAIWGGPAREEKKKTRGGQSKVQVVVTNWSGGTTEYPFEKIGKRVQARKESIVPAYAAFPLQPDGNERQANAPMQPVFKGVRFTLQLTFEPAHQDDIRAALWAWETFGGIGARTRRGFGALRLKSVNGVAVQDLPPADAHSFRQWLTEQLRRHISDEAWPEDIPHLVRQLRFKILTGGSVPQLWKNLINRLQRFRQQRRSVDNDEPSKYGHSDWPEPNAIRRLFGRPPRGPHATRTIDKFPRSQFGLPIVFHMYHDEGLDVTLEGETHPRLASPLILKPVACRHDKAIGLAVVLEGTRLPRPLVLKQDDRAVHSVDAVLTKAEAQEIPPLNGQVDVLQAFLDTL